MVIIVSILLCLIHPALMILIFFIFGYWEKICEKFWDIDFKKINIFKTKTNKNIERKEPSYPLEIQKIINIQREIEQQKEKPSKFLSYDDYIKSPEWKKLRLRVLSKAGYKCSLCGRSAEHVHHLYYPKRYEDDKIKYLIAVCKDCHIAIHEEGRWK